MITKARERLYTVTELARELSVTARSIRFYEDKGLIAPQRAGNNRVYTGRDRARLMLILRGKRLGFRLREIKEYLDLYDTDVSQKTQLGALIKSVRQRMGLLEEQRHALDETLRELRDIETQATTALAGRSRVRINAAGETQRLEEYNL
jgi:DNA-binding transcriptional MerR regulator